MCKEERTVNQETNVQEKEARVRQPWTAQRVGDILLNNALLIIMAIAVVYIAIKNPNFIKPASLINILSQTAAYLPAALGIGGCIVLTGTDLSGGRVVGLTAAVAGALLQDRTISRKLFSNLPAITPGWILLTVLIVVAIGALIGMVNGFFVAKFSLHPFIVTLATQLITYGLILIFFMLNGNNGQPVSGLSQEYKNVVSAPLFQFTTSKGATISIRELVNLPIVVHDFETGIKTEQGEDRCLVQIEMNGEMRKFFTNSEEMKNILQQIREMPDGFPFETTIKAEQFGKNKTKYVFT